METRVSIAQQEWLLDESPLATPEVLSIKRPALAVNVYEDSLVCPRSSTVFGPERELIRETVWWDEMQRSIHWPAQEAVLKLHGNVATLQVWRLWQHHYHWYIDCLPRLFALHHPAVRALGPVRLVMTSTMDPFKRRQVGLIVPQGTEMLFVEQDCMVQAQRVLHLPYYTQTEAGLLPASVIRGMRLALGVPIYAKRTKRILISRQKCQVRRMLNFDAVEAALQARGFQTVVLESLGIETQVELFAQASTVVGMHGAGLTNLLFARECRVLELFAGEPIHHYRWLAHAMGHRYASLVHLHGAKAYKHCNAIVPIDALMRKLDQLENEE